MNISDNISIKCPQCSETSFEFSELVDDTDLVKCNNCNFQIMLADLKEVGFEQAKEAITLEVESEIQKIFNTIKGSFK